MIVDATDKKKFEESLIESQRKLKEQNLELKKLDKLKSDFITIAAHELKTPLISIIGYLDLVISRDKELNSETLDDLTKSLNCFISLAGLPADKNTCKILFLES